MSSDHTVKVVIFGDAAVGKTSLLKYFVNGDASAHTVMTIGVDFKVKKVHRVIGDSQEQVRVQVWDTAGHAKFRTVPPMIYKGAQGPTAARPIGLLVCYDCCDRTTFDEGVDFWVNELRMHASDNVVTCLIGNKKDKAAAGNREVSTEEGEALAKTLGMDQFFETSACTGECVEETFLAVVDKVLARIIHDEKLAEANPASMTSATTKITPASLHASQQARAQAEQDCMRGVLQWLWRSAGAGRRSQSTTFPPSPGAASQQNGSPTEMWWNSFIQRG